MKEADFLNQIEKRLQENKKVLASSPVPKKLQPVVSYFGFHTFRSMVLLALLVVVLCYLLGYEELMNISKRVFLLE